MHNAACTRNRTQRTPCTADVLNGNAALKAREIHCDEVNALARDDVRLKPVASADVEDACGRLAPLNGTDDRERGIDVSARPTAGYDDVHSSFTILLKSRPRSS